MSTESSSLRADVVPTAEVPAGVRTYFEALNAEDWDTLAGVWAEEAELRAVGSRPRHGREAIMAYFRPIFAPWAEHLDQPTRHLVAPGAVVVEVAFRGVTHAGKELAFDAVDVFDLSDGKIVRLTTWYDLTWVRKQL